MILRPSVIDIGSWPEGENPWDGAEVDVISVPENVFLYRRAMELTVQETAYPGCTSIFEPDPDVIDRFSQISTEYNFRVMTKRKVTAVTLDDLGLHADLIKLDIQGAELSVLLGGRETLDLAVAVQVEVEFMPLYRGQPTAGEVFRYLEDEGFYLHQLRDCGGSPFKPFETAKPYLPASQLLYADAVFIRDINALRSGEIDRLIAVLWHIYKSYDLAIHLMATVDPHRAVEMLSMVSSTQSTAITMKADRH